MKLCNLLYHEQRPQMKCGPGLALAATAGSSLVGGVADNILGYNQSSHMLNRQMDFQRNENQVNRDWQTEQAEIARTFESQQTLQQNQFTKDLAAQQQQYNQQNQRMQAYYNSPVYQRRQLQAANINPQVYFGSQSSFSGSSAPAAGLPSAPAGAKGHMPAGVQGLSPVGIQPPALQIGQLAQGIAGSLKSLAEAKKLGVETDWIDDRMKAEIRKLNVDSDYTQVLTLGQKIANQLENAKLPYAFEMAATQLRLAVSQLELNEENKFTLQSVKRVNNALEKLHLAQASLTDKESEKLGIELPLWAQYLKSTINKNSADAGLASAQAKTENEFRATRGAILGLQYAIQHNEVEISDETKKARILDVLQKAVEQKWNTQDAYIKYLQDKYNLDTRGVKDIMNILYGWIPFTSKID